MKESFRLLFFILQLFDASVNLLLVPKFNERDPDILFVLFESRKWSDDGLETHFNSVLLV